jgi:phosphoenolpyruvate-protein kinase (PTS system EI component)
VWVAPSDALAETLRAKRAALVTAALEEEERALVSLAHLGVAVRANVGAVAESIPRAAEGIGLLRTELVFAGSSRAPSEAEQVSAILALSQKATGGGVVVRLFDAGGDKPLSWLSPPAHDPDARGIALLFSHPEILDAQLRALGRARLSAEVYVLLPLVRSEQDVHDVRARAHPSLAIGAMVETPAAADRIDGIAAAADFVCIGTNDLAAFVLGVDRSQATIGIDAGVLGIVSRIVQGAHARGKKVTVCGEMAADDRGAKILVGLGVDALSMAPARVPPVRLLLARATRSECEELARAFEGTLSE